MIEMNRVYLVTHYFEGSPECMVSETNYVFSAKNRKNLREMIKETIYINEFGGEFITIINVGFTPLPEGEIM